MDLVHVLLRTIFFYFFIIVCYRIMGKREIGQLSISDLTISILIAELVAISIENRTDSTILTISPILLLVFLEVLLAFVQLKFNRLRDFMEGKPSVIIDAGKINIKEMIKQRYNFNDLLLALREKSIKSIKDVSYAILETNGKLSIFKNKVLESDYPLPIIIDSIVDTKTLKRIHKTRAWLEQSLLNNNLYVDDILYAFYKLGRIYVIRK